MIGYAFTRQADRELRQLPVSDQRRLVTKLKTYLASPNPLRHAKKLEGVTGKIYRFRVGTYRVIFEWSGIDILVLRVGHRKDVYRG